MAEQSHHQQHDEPLDALAGASMSPNIRALAALERLKEGGNISPEDASTILDSVRLNAAATRLARAALKQLLPEDASPPAK